MDEWRERLAGIDDDYLIGISNKGIVKRAYKDMEEGRLMEEGPSMEEENSMEGAAAGIGALGEEVVVKVGAETVTVRFPLGESKCTCPSRSICRHVVHGILILRERCLGGGMDSAGQDAQDLSAAGTANGQDARAADDGGSPVLCGPEAAQNPEGSLVQEAAQRLESSLVQEAAQRPESSSAQEAVQNPKGSPVQETAQRPEGSPVRKAAQKPEGSPVQVAAQNPKSSPSQKATQESEPIPDSGIVPGRSGSTNQNQNNDINVVDKNRHSPAWKEIDAYPFDKLQKALGSRYFQAFVNQAAGGIRPVIQESSVVTVHLPEQGMTVKLLSPLEYSTCTCHKKELCRHKAAAILWCQMETGVLTREALRAETADTPVYDLEEVRDAAGQMERFLEELLGTGLSRVSPDVPDYLERLAIISHNARLSRFEGYFRALADSYGRYFARKAVFRTEDLMEQLTRLYRRVQLLGQATGQMEGQVTGQEAVGKLAGEFRAGYLPVGNLDLIGIAMEHFRSQTGYEGETVYFLEEKTKQWYTYTNARPVFYDESKKKGAWRNRQAGAPWGLNISFENLLKVRIHLNGAKCDSRNRLSSSQETKGEVTGEAGLHVSDIAKWYYQDFGALFREQIWKQQRTWLAEEGEPDSPGDTGQEDAGGKGVEPLFVQPKSCARAEFSQTEQRLTLPLYDAAGRELLVEVAYSKEEAGTIRYLERISGKKPPCFLGKVYLRDGRLRMYPVDLLEIEAPDGEAAPGGGSAPVDVTARQGGSVPAEGTATEGRDAGENGSVPAERTATESGDAGENGSTLAEATATEDRSAGENESAVAEQTASGTAESKEGAAAISTDHKPKFLVMEDMAAEILSLMADLCQSGFSTVHDSTLKGLQKSAALTAQYGMEYLSGLLAALEQNLAANRHRIAQENGPLAGIYTEISEYLYLMKQKNEYSRGEDYYGE
nr:SWIM zinc finger family protein [uncultured Acetatifactor sp.]